MKIGFFCESVIADYNNDSIYFLRGVVNELITRGHQVVVFEKENNSALVSVTREFGKTGVTEFKRIYPHIEAVFYKTGSLSELKPLLKDCQHIFVHNSAEKDLLPALLDIKTMTGCRLFYFDSSLPLFYQKNDYLTGFDAVLASGTKLKDLYLANGFRKVFLWQEAVDTRVFQPRKAETEGQVVLISNWTDEDRSAEIDEFLIQPVKYLRVKARVYGAKYPRVLKKQLTDAGIEYAGWAPSFKAAEIYARFVTTIFLPGSESVNECPLNGGALLPLACGIPMISAGWKDQEKQLNRGRDFLFAKDGYEMKHYILEMMNSTLKEVITGHGIKSVNMRHTCTHRVNELDKILESIGIEKINNSIKSTVSIHG
jgi:spore maturation protein CgeB